MTSALLDISDLTFVAGGQTILDRLDLAIDPGEIHALLGANGSGKTSLLSALTGYLMPTAGEIAALGERYGEADWRVLRTRVGLVSSALRQMMADTEPALDTVASGRFGADMKVSLTNDGPVTFWLQVKPGAPQ